MFQTQTCKHVDRERDWHHTLPSQACALSPATGRGKQTFPLTLLEGDIPVETLISGFCPLPGLFLYLNNFKLIWGLSSGLQWGDSARCCCSPVWRGYSHFLAHYMTFVVETWSPQAECRHSAFSHSLGFVDFCLLSDLSELIA